MIEKLYNFRKEEYVNMFDSKTKNKLEEYDDTFKKSKKEALKEYKASQDYAAIKAKVEECRNKYLKQK